MDPRTGAPAPAPAAASAAPTTPRQRQSSVTRKATGATYVLVLLWPEGGGAGEDGFWPARKEQVGIQGEQEEGKH